MEIADIWPTLRGLVRDEFTFSEIKELGGASGLPVHQLSHLSQGSSKTSKGTLLDALDGQFIQFAEEDRNRITENLIREIWTRMEAVRARLIELLERFGWGITDGEPHPLVLQVNVEVTELPEDQRELLSKALRRYRDGDFDGAVTAICSMVDDLTEAAYQQHNLGDHRNASYQERVNVAFRVREIGIKDDLDNAGFSNQEVTRTWDNLRSSVNGSAYVLGAFRREISDVHGCSNAPRQLVQQALDAATYIIRNLAP